MWDWCLALVIARHASELNATDLFANTRYCILLGVVQIHEHRPPPHVHHRAQHDALRGHRSGKTKSGAERASAGQALHDHDGDGSWPTSWTCKYMFAGRDADMPPNSNIPRAPYTNLIRSRPVA